MNHIFDLWFIIQINLYDSCPLLLQSQFSVLPLAHFWVGLFNCTKMISILDKIKISDSIASCFRQWLMNFSSFQAMGVWSTAVIPRGTRFGPLVGETYAKDAVLTNVNRKYFWRVCITWYRQYNSLFLLCYAWIFFWVISFFIKFCVECLKFLNDKILSMAVISVISVKNHVTFAKIPSLKNQTFTFNIGIQIFTLRCLNSQLIDVF